MHPTEVRVQLRMPSEVACIEQTVSLVTRHCLSGSAANDNLRFRLQVALAEALANAHYMIAQDLEKYARVAARVARFSHRPSVASTTPEASLAEFNI